MARYGISRRLAAEALGAAFLVSAIVGSGIMAARLTGDVALQLLCNTLATGAILVVLITTLGPISGAHFNPAVTLAFRLRNEISVTESAGYVVAQITGAIAGAVAAHLMFALPAIQVATTARNGPAQWLSEIVATFGLVGAVLAGARFRGEAVPWLVGLYITAAYWFTASTAFANPAVTIARSLTATFSGVRALDAPAFIVAEILGALLSAAFFGWLLGAENENPEAGQAGPPDQADRVRPKQAAAAPAGRAERYQTE